MNILALPVITAISFLILYRMNMNKVHPITIVLTLIAIAGSLSWLFVYSSWEDALVISAIFFTVGFLVTFGLKPNKDLVLINLINRLSFLMAALVSFSEGLLHGIPSIEHYAQHITTVIIVIVLVIGGILIWKKIKQ